MEGIALCNTLQYSSYSYSFVGDARGGVWRGMTAHIYGFFLSCVLVAVYVRDLSLPFIFLSPLVVVPLWFPQVPVPRNNWASTAVFPLLPLLFTSILTLTHLYPNNTQCPHPFPFPSLGNLTNLPITRSPTLRLWMYQ